MQREGSLINVTKLAALRGLSTMALVAAALAAPSSVFAQESPNAAEAQGVDMIVVTAQFRGQNLQDTPLAISAVSAEMIEARGQIGVADIANRAPSVTLQAGGGPGGAQTTQINIRGVGQTDFNIALEPGVGMYVDDVYRGIMYASTPELLDLERVEILRGPQGTLSGRNSVGGAIRLISKQPDGDTEGYVQGTYGSYNRMDLRAGVNFSLIEDRLFARITGIARHRDGYVTRLDYECANGRPPAPVHAGSQAAGRSNCVLGTEGGQSVVAMRGSFRAILSDSIENTVTLDYMADRSEPSANILIHQGNWRGPGFNLTANPQILNTPQNFVLPAGSFTNYANYTGLIGTPEQYSLNPESNATDWGISNILDVDLTDSISVKSITAWRGIRTHSTVDSDASPLNRLLQAWDVEHHQFTQELRLSGQVDDLLNWTVGGFYYVGHSLQGGRAGLDGAGDNSLAPPLQVYTPMDFAFSDPIDVKSRAAFAHLELHPFDRFTLTGGLRYTEDTKSYEYHRFLAPGVPATLLSASVLPLNNLTGRFEGNRWDWRVAANYELTNDINVYGQIATGFKGGGVNPRPYYAIQIRPFEPESVVAYELGIKADLFDRAMRLNVAAYINDFSNMQLSLLSCPEFVPPASAPNCSMPANVGNATIKGIEVETEIHPLEGLTIDGSLSYLDFKYDSVVASTRVTLDMISPYTPKWQFAVGAQYEIDLGDAGSLTPRFDYSYRSEVWADPINTAANFLPGRGLANARLTYRNADADWDLALSVSNVFNKYYYVNLYERALPTTRSYQIVSGQPGRPREWALAASYRF